MKAAHKHWCPSQRSDLCWSSDVWLQHNQVKHDHTPDQESKPQRLHWQATWHAQQRRTDEQRLTTPWTKTPRHNSSGTVQAKFKTNSKTKFQEDTTAKQQHVTILSCRGFSYGSAIFLDPLTATSLDHQHTLVQIKPKCSRHSQKRSGQSQNRAVKTVDKLNCRTWQPNWKTVAKEPNESTCVQLNANDIKPATSSNSSWHQLHNNENEHQMNWHHNEII